MNPDGSFSRNSVSIRGNVIESVGSGFDDTGANILNADGNLLLPGLNDHHVHLASYAASLVSVDCGPPVVTNEADLSAVINQEGQDWLRGIGFHESVLPGLNRTWLDQHGPDRPVRIQHRSGRLWILNSQALALIDAQSSDLDEHERARLVSKDGHLYDVDELLGNIIRKSAPPLAQASLNLAACGITGLNDMTPSNDDSTWRWFNELQQSGDLLQHVRLSGRADLSSHIATELLTTGETKVHLHDSALPEFIDFVEAIRASHAVERAIAVHCVTEVELVYTLSALRVAGPMPGDRIEHASVVPPNLIEQLRELGVSVVTQPNFIRERGDTYVHEIPAEEHPYLYRIRSLQSAGIPTAFGTDLPFGQPDPWVAMDAAVKRTSVEGVELGVDEQVTPEAALKGFLGSLDDPFTARHIIPGATADLCLMDVPWPELREDLSSSHVAMTLINGRVVYERK